jgi:hypothetical protein
LLHGLGTSGRSGSVWVDREREIQDEAAASVLLGDDGHGRYLQVMWAELFDVGPQHNL